MALLPERKNYCGGNVHSEDLAARASRSWDTVAGVSFGRAWIAARAPESL